MIHNLRLGRLPKHTYDQFGPTGQTLKLRPLKELFLDLATTFGSMMEYTTGIAKIKPRLEFPTTGVIPFGLPSVPRVSHNVATRKKVDVKILSSELETHHYPWLGFCFTTCPVMDVTPKSKMVSRLCHQWKPLSVMNLFQMSCLTITLERTRYAHFYKKS